MTGILSSLLLILLIGCSDSTSVFEPKESDVIRIDLDYGLNSEYPLSKDGNGYYHMTLGNTWQTTQRISGTAYINDVPLEVLRVQWESDLMWYLGDTLGYIVNRNFNDDGMYVSVDTSYITGFNGMEVPTINCCSYSNSKGEFNQMSGFVRPMIGDTALIEVSYGIREVTNDSNIMRFYVVLD